VGFSFRKIKEGVVVFDSSFQSPQQERPGDTGKTETQDSTINPFKKTSYLLPAKDTERQHLRKHSYKE